MLTPSELGALLHVARARNLAAGVTGLLLHADGNFMQYLEGSHDALEPIWSSIQRDPRHHRLSVLLDGPAERREFAGWSMAFGTRDLPPFLATAAGRRAAPSTPLSPAQQLIRAMWSAMLPGEGRDDP